MTSLDPSPMLPHATPPAPASSKTRRWMPWAIATAILLVIGSIALALGAVMNAAAPARDPSGDPLVVGDPGFHHAAILECADPCFDEADIAATVLSDATLDALGLTQHDSPWGTNNATTPAKALRATTASWAADDGAPDACVFVLGTSPSVVDLESDQGLQDPIEFTGEHAASNSSSTLDQSIRIFPDTASAMGYMSRLNYQVAGCDEISTGSPAERQTAQVTAAPQLGLPEDVASVGWVRTGETGPQWRAYVFDMQRGNLIVRTSLSTDGSISELDFRAFVEKYAIQFASIAPAG